MAAPLKISRKAVLPQGFTASGVASGIKSGGKLDLGLLVSDRATTCAATFTTNKVKAAPVRLSARNLKAGDLRAVVVNSGNANACNGQRGAADARAMAKSAAEALELDARQMFVCSTGIIGVPLPVDCVSDHAGAAAGKLRTNGFAEFSRAIMTSDKVNKVASVTATIGGKKVTISGAAKGAGMICPNMATLLVFITTDAVVDEAFLQGATRNAVDQSFNSITVDGDMSTNDTVLVMANGAVGNRRIRSGAAGKEFQAALSALMLDLAQRIVRDGEGATKFVTIEVRGAASDRDACKIGQAVANSALVKCSWNGSDPNWGRVIHAIGYAGARVDESKVDIYFNGHCGAKSGVAATTPISRLKQAVAKKEFVVTIDLNLGKGSRSIYTSDLSVEYVDYNRLEYALKIQGR